MECDYEVTKLDRIYLPANGTGINAEEYLLRYIEREFPSSSNGQSVVYSIPNKFEKTGEIQANLSEKRIFDNLLNLQNSYKSQIDEQLWMIFFHSTCYAGHSYRNQRIGRLMIREHDFVIFVKYKGNFFVVFIEVKSTNDIKDDLEKKSDSKLIKNNKRSAQHQLRDHMEIITDLFNNISLDGNKIQCYIMWPFLTSTTKSPNGQTIKRWHEDGNLHVFEDKIQDAERFTEWFASTVLGECNRITEKFFNTLLNRYIILSCGVFVDEINNGMLALLTQSQLKLLNSKICCKSNGGPLIVHGAAGTGKTMLVLRKLQQLYQTGKLNEHNRALYICYWPGIRCYVQESLKKLGIADYVDTIRFFITMPDFLVSNKNKYKHIFMDEAEAICLAFSGEIVKNTCASIYERYHAGNCTINNCPHFSTNIVESIKRHINNEESSGELWFLVDINQASLFLPKQSPDFLKVPTFTLDSVMRCTNSIFNFFNHFYNRPIPDIPLKIPNIYCGHHIDGPPIYWINFENPISWSVAKIIIDLCATKGVKPKDICVLPFLRNENVTVDNINAHIESNFVENGYKPNGINDVDRFVKNAQLSDFLFSWVLKVKGLEFKVVIMIIDDDDYDDSDPEDRKKLYIMASRCTCMLIVVCNKGIRDIMNLQHFGQEYTFSMKLSQNVQ